MALASDDEVYMRRCLALARQWRGHTAPNPMVGCVVVAADGEVLGEGAHAGPGLPHAEVVALRAVAVARDRLAGATLYVNLEPCTHTGRTPPCAPMVANAGVARVVIGGLDPIAAHAGGAAALRAAGLAVTTGVLEAECEALNAGFYQVARLGRPYVVAKAACSLDGHIATRTGESQWITGTLARAHAMQGRAHVDAIVVGVGTVLADDPQLTLRGEGSGDRPPLQRVVFDTALRTPPTARLLPANAGDTARTTIFAAQATLDTSEGATRADALRGRGASIVALRTSSEIRGLPVLPALQFLANQGVHSVLVEGGAALHASFAQADAVDELRIYYAPMVLGAGGKSWLGDIGCDRLADAPRFALIDAPTVLDGDLAVRWRRVRPAT